MSIGKVKEFDIKSGVWSSYVERLEMYFTVNNVKSDLKLPTLIAMMGDEAYELLVNLSSPKKPAELKYEDAIELLRRHLQPAPSVLAERFRFRQRRQAADENIASYVAELKKLTRHCKLGDNLNENLRDQFVCGLRSDLIRQRLFAEEETISFANAVKLANSLEAAERDAAAVDTAGAAEAAGAARGADGAAAAALHTMAGTENGRWRRSAARARSVQDQSAARNVAGARTRSSVKGTGYRCKGCTSTLHSYEACRFRDYVCSRCQSRGHIRRACVQEAGAGSGRFNAVHYGDAEGIASEEEVESDFHHLCLNDYKAVSLPVLIDNVEVKMEVDTGTAVSCINNHTYEKHFSKIRLEPTSVRLNFYDGSVLKPVGVIKPVVSYGKIKKNLELFVIEGGTTSLLGRQWLTELKIKIPLFSNCHKISETRGLGCLDNELRNLVDRYKELFSGGLGRYSGGKATLRVREGATPVFHRARALPYALRDRVDAELDAMLRDGVIEPVDCSDWASPLVPVNKADGSLRICADYKATVNPVLLVDRYPLPRIDDLIVRLSGSNYFSKIDLSQAYNQIELDDSKNITVINTHRGLYRYNRLVYGLASSAGIFQRIMSNLLQDIPNVEVFLDDVVIGGKNRQEHLRAVESVFSRLHRYGLKLKSNKCVFLVDEIKYLGYVLNKEGIKTDPDKIEAITKIPRPSNVTELRSFLGLVNFYAKFVRNMSARLVPLYELLKRDTKWVWSKECERAFKEVKTLLTSAEVLSHYDPARPLIVTCDASAKGIGAVLSQPSRNGDCERPVAYASRTLNDAEKNYSQIHREALAIIFSVHKFHQYLYGRHFTLRTDHKPLVSIFGPHTGIPTMVASRMQRWAIILSAYTFDIEYVRTDKNGADGLSRLPMTGKQLAARQVPEQTYLHFIQEALLLDYNEIKKHTTRDPDLSKILSYLRDGWPTENSITNLQPYFNRKNELYEELGCVMWGHRLVVPETCRDRVLKMIHEPHMGIVKSKSLARSYVWWPSLDESIQRVCQGCEVCAAQADAPPKQAVRMWPWPNRPWSRIHLDFMGPIFGKTYLVIVDATSKWIEVFQVPNTASTVVIDRLTELFSRFGLAKQIITDNASYFASTEFRNFTQSNGIEHIFTAPYHPASNGLAENAVRTLKRVIKKAVSERQNVDRALWTFLMHYRNTEHSTTGECPAMLLLGRRLRTKLDALKPDRERKVAKVQQHQREMAKGVEREVKPEDEVWYRQYLKREKWVPGQVVECTGPSNYKVRSQDGDLVHRHIDQLKKRSTRFSLACPTTSLNQESSTDPQSPAALSEQVQPERSTRGDIEAPVTPGSSTGSDKAHTNTPASPEFQDAVESNESPAQTRRRSTSPARAITPEPRPLRQCRIRKPFNKL
ncbi:uncharacterized protein K02A2.6-like isoform X1 [Maniola jurtina]|uniref:uncharacterized protein K02A2.6-like isoform X1 n=2 Tax=Maniola jurtina TaxID=191418 RepID=UPI001E686989|nr:uncharacterized protein K02A2.6-like isoform X1 [Maniola jurtina]